MKFTNEVTLSLFPVELTHADQIVTVGSCFTDEIGARFRYHGFDCLPNFGGTIFHPSAIARLLTEMLDDAKNYAIVQREDVFFSWHMGGTIFAYTEQDLKLQMNQLYQNAVKQLSEAKFLFITLGSAIGYRLFETQEIVANCHKLPAAHFQKELTPLETLKSEWTSLLERMKAQFPQLNVVFTVSPVRYVKDGLVENNRSKARLIELVNHLTDLNMGSYFPAYEIVIDELRDYRFFKADGFHPNELAIDVVWERLEKTMMPIETCALNQRVANFRKQFSHQSIYQDSIATQRFETKRAADLAQFLQNSPEVSW